MLIVPHTKHTYGPPRPVTGMALYVHDVCTLQEIYLWASTVCYGDSFTFLYVNDIRTSQETHLWACTAPRPAMGTALLSYM
jgi:hypothetical protein